MLSQERIYEDLSTVTKRAAVAFRVVLVLIFLVLAYYWKLQVLNYKKYYALAENNRTRVRTVSAPRGVIKDRNGVILADNRPSFKVLLLRENLKDPGVVYEKLGELLSVDSAQLRARAEKYAGVPVYEPVVIMDGLSLAEVAPVESRRLDLPEVVVDFEPQRYYPRGSLAAHVLGYLQERTPEDARTGQAPKPRPGDLGGKTGIEKAFDPVLTGRDGSFVEVVDSRGKSRGELRREAPTPGRELVLTLDAELQARAEALLGGREGVILVLDPRNGEVLTMANSPSYDPNKFITRFTPSEWLALMADPSSPLENRAIRGLYAPGSIFKVVMALAGLDSGLIDENTTVYCSGSTVIYGMPFACWFSPGHGSMNLPEAIRNSCNIYFYDLGRRLGIEKIAEAARRVGLGSNTGIELPGEKSGLVPDPAWKKHARGEPWYPGETIPVSIGQGSLLVTPLQVAAVTARVANRGRPVRPRLVMSGRSEDPAPEPAATAFSRADFEKVVEGMWRSVNRSGTGAAAYVEGFDVCGKTGSTQVMSRDNLERMKKLGREVKTHSWFSGFAPRDDPRVVVTVLVEFGGGGGATAAPLAGQLFSLFLEKERRGKGK